MPDVSVPWGDDALHVSLPAHWNIQQVAEPQLRPAAESWPEQLGEALAQPGTHLPLGKLLAARRNGRVAFIVEDITRHSPLPQILDVVMREVRHANIPKEQLEVFLALGMHQPMTEAQIAEKLGPAAEGVRVRGNPWDDRTAYVRVGRIGKVEVLADRGVAEADLRILVSSVAPHLQAGFGGGYKMLFPGATHLDTIRELHRLGVARVPRQLVGTEPERNAMRTFIDAAGRLVDEAHGTTFSIQYLLDASNRPTSIAAGEPIATHRMLAKQCSVSCGIVTDAPADVLITNAHPLDYDLWQSFKCIANTRWAARPNAPIVCLTRCEAALGGMKVPFWPMSPKWTRRVVGWLGPEALGALVMRLIPRLAGDAAFFVRMALQTLHRNPILMVSPALFRSGGGFPGLEVYEHTEDAIAAAQGLTGSGPQRVTVFPFGGTTFPIPTNDRGARPAGGASE